MDRFWVAIFTVATVKGTIDMVESVLTNKNVKVVFLHSLWHEATPYVILIIAKMAEITLDHSQRS